MMQGLLRVSSEKEIELLVDEFEGLKFKLTDGVEKWLLLSGFVRLDGCTDSFRI